MPCEAPPNIDATRSMANRMPLQIITLFIQGCPAVPCRPAFGEYPNQRQHREATATIGCKIGISG